MDTEALRSFVRAAELGRLQYAADELGLSQQAVSKRIAALERELGIRLFTRGARGVELTLDGQTFLPHARGVVAALERAVASVRPGSRALRIDVLGLRSAQAVVLHDYWRAHPEIELDVVTVRVDDPQRAVAAIESGEIDAAFRSLPDWSRLPETVQAVHGFDSLTEVLVGPRHPLAAASAVSPEQLVPHRIWVPGIAKGSEWEDFYRQLADGFGLRIDATGPNFGNEVLLEILAESDDVATLVGARDRYLWPVGYDLRRIPVAGPALAYPLSLLMRRDNPHPALADIVAHLRGLPRAPVTTWRPRWALSAT